MDALITGIVNTPSDQIVPKDTLASTTSASGATLIGLYDIGRYYSIKNVETALSEIGQGITLDGRYAKLDQTTPQTFTGTFTLPVVKAVHKALDGTAAVANGTYTVGLGLTVNGTITIKDGIITAIQQAS